MKQFAITGVAGYIAPRHLNAIKEVNGNLTAALDPHDSVGLLDRYFPDVSFFIEFERFERHLEKIHRESPDDAIDFLSICSPNHLHDAHIRLGLRLNADVICEKPLVLNPWNLDLLQELEEETKRKIYTVLQLRVHPSIVELHEKYNSSKSAEKHEVELTYITSRGKWYYFSWKGDKAKSGGVATNIGVHFFDMLSWIFGDVQESYVHLSEDDKMSGYLELENARVKWYLSLDKNDLPGSIKGTEQTTYRSIKVDGDEIEFTKGFTDLHTRIYEEILKGNGFGITDARNSIQLVSEIRRAKTIEKGELHPFYRNKRG